MFEKVATIENITRAIRKASENKRRRPEVVRVLSDIERHAYLIYKMLWTKTYKPCAPKETLIKEGAKQKERIVTKINFFPDQIIHWVIMLQVAPIITKSAYQLSCGCMPGRGVHYGKKYMERWIRGDRKNTKYCLKMDIRKFYPSLCHHFVKEQIRRRIKDPKMLWLLDAIIDVYKLGLPIGFLTSQWLANFVLQPLDYLIKQKIKVRYYLRYMDDLVLFGPNKKKLRKIISQIEDYLKSCRLEVKENYQVFPVDKRAVDVMGFRFFRHKTILRKSLMLRMTRRARRIWRKGMATPRDATAILSYLGWVRHANVHGMFRKWIKSIISIKHMKAIVRKFSRGELKKNEGSPVRKRRIPRAA